MRAAVDRRWRLDRAEAARGVVGRLDDETLGGLLRDFANGWGRTVRVAVERHLLFVKAVPLTDDEVRAGVTTANLYEIPTYLNYPFGSPGLGAGRELAFARRSTGWVESGACPGFPILVHDRVVPRHVVGGQEPPAGYSAYRGESPGMNRYLADRASANAYLVLVYEDIPFTAVNWLIDRPSDAAWILDDVRSTLRFLREQDVVHFDVDLFNVLTDGRHAYLADHGLVLDGSFQLTDTERQFLKSHQHFDEGNLMMSFGHQLYWAYRALRADERAKAAERLEVDGMPFEVAVSRLLDAFAGTGDGPFELELTLRSLIERYRPVILHMHAFYSEARRNWDDTTRLDDAQLARLLAAANDEPRRT